MRRRRIRRLAHRYDLRSYAVWFGLRDVPRDVFRCRIACGNTAGFGLLVAA